MDSSPIAPKKPQLLIGNTSGSGSTNNPKPLGVSGLKRDSSQHENGDTNNISIKKPRTTIASDPINKSMVILNPKPLTVIEADTRKLSRQFWKAGGDEEDKPAPRYCNNDAAVRVHPQFLHANATSHKWALGALAELLDNSLDEVCNGATYVHVDSKTNPRDEKSNILIIEDNGGGMDPTRFRECLSLGFSRKRNMPNVVGQYGNGFKTSTMRLGADAIVFTRCKGTNGNNTTQSIGMLSYTFLYETRKCEAIVPTIDFELVDNEWKPIVYNSKDEWFDNLDTIEKWSPYLSQEDLFDQFNNIEDQGTRIVIYNLWEDDEAKLELDFDTDPHDIQLRGVNRGEKNIEMANAYPNSRHFLTYRHSLRSYASILYLRLPSNFKMILRGKEVEHHNLVDDMMMVEEKTYTPQNTHRFASIKLGFVKDARHHIDIQGFNVYHKNRLIKPFWRVWHAAGSDGRGVIGIVEANFIQPAHNKQGFERTSVLAKLENRLSSHQKNYWSTMCHKIGYAPRRKQKNHESSVTETTRQHDQPQAQQEKGSSSSTVVPAQYSQNAHESFLRNQNAKDGRQGSGFDMKPEIGLKNKAHGLGISINETGSINPSIAELNKAKEESAKQVAELRRQKVLLELQSAKQVAELHKQKALLELQSARQVAELQKQKALLDQSAKQVTELQKQKALLELQSRKQVAELQKQKALLEQSGKQVAELQKEKEPLELQSAKQVAELQKQKALLEQSRIQVAELQTQKAVFELELKKSEAKIQELEKAQNSVEVTIQEERARRDVTEDRLRKQLRELSAGNDDLVMEIKSLKEENEYCKKRHMHMR